VPKISLISPDALVATVVDLCVAAAYKLPQDVLHSLQEAVKNEDNERAKYILLRCVENAAIAENGKFPICQDTGSAMFFVEIGKDVHIEGDKTVGELINEGVRISHINEYLRKSIVCDPIVQRKNTKDNTPAVIYQRQVSGGEIKLHFMAKGGGGENCSRLAMLTPSQGLQGLVDAAVETVRLAGGKCCPPSIVGVGGGITADDAMVLSKAALLLPMGKRNQNKDFAEAEIEIIKKCNELGIGPQGLGGKTTVLDAHIVDNASHIASMPVGVSLSCHASRHKSAIIKGREVNYGRD
jgi:fumarate hydratase subunit alpha